MKKNNREEKTIKETTLEMANSARDLTSAEFEKVKTSIENGLQETVDQISGKKKQRRDPRIDVTTSMGWKWITFFVIVFILAMVESVSFFYSNVSLLGVFGYYIIMLALLIGFILLIIRWRFNNRPIEGLAAAARKVAAGDFTVRAKQNRKDGKLDELGVLIEDFNHMTEELSKTEMLKNDFVSNVSHELKTPLSIISSYAQALQDTDLTEEERKQYLSVIINTSQSMSILVSNILNLSKLENQQRRPDPTVYHLGEQLRHCALHYMEKWLEKDIAFEIDVVDVSVCYDEPMMEILWHNLLSNAIKYTDPGGKVSMTSVIEGEHVRVSIRDNGCGIEKEEQSRIFDKFYQCDHSHSSEGNGLGLALVAKILDAEGGSLELESTPGEGSCFTVVLSIHNNT